MFLLEKRKPDVLITLLNFKFIHISRIYFCIFDWNRFHSLFAGHQRVFHWTYFSFQLWFSTSLSILDYFLLQFRFI